MLAQEHLYTTHKKHALVACPRTGRQPWSKLTCQPWALAVSLYTLICMQGLGAQLRQKNGSWILWQLGNRKRRKQRKANGSRAGGLSPKDSMWLCDNVMIVCTGPFQELLS